MPPTIRGYRVVSPTTPSSTDCDTTAVQPTDHLGRFDVPRKKSKSPPPCVNLKKNTFPQVAVDKFWRDFTSKKPGKTFTILPGNVRAKRAAIEASIHAETPTNAVASYEQAAEACKVEIDNIVRDCLRMNQKYKDPDFDIEWDLSTWLRCHHVEDCLVPLGKEEVALRPRSVKRVEVSCVYHFLFASLESGAHG